MEDRIREIHAAWDSLVSEFGHDYAAIEGADHELLTERVPDDIKYAVRRLLIEHGRAYCTARNPQCDESPVCREYCSYYRDVVDGDVSPDAYPGWSGPTNDDGRYKPNRTRAPVRELLYASPVYVCP